MLNPVKPTPQELKKVDEFYGLIHAGTAPDSPGGAQIRVAELEIAARALESVSPAVRRAAWSDVIDRFADQIDDGFLRGLRATLATLPRGLRAENRYIALEDVKEIARGPHLPRITHRMEFEARREAIREAIEHQIDPGDERRAHALRALLNLVDGCRRVADLALLRAGWPLIIKDPPPALAPGSAASPGAAAIPTIVAAAAAAAAVDAAAAVEAGAAGAQAAAGAAGAQAAAGAGAQAAAGAAAAAVDAGAAGAQAAAGAAAAQAAAGAAVAADPTKYVVSVGGVKALGRILRTFQSQQAPAERADDFLATLRRRAEARAAEAEDATIGGVSVAQLRHDIDALSLQQGTPRLIFDASKMRLADYRDTVKQIYKNPTVQRVMPAIKRAMAESEERFRLQQAASGGLVLDSKSMDLAAGFAYARPLFDLTQEVGRKLGMTHEVTLVIATSLEPNAFVYTADLDNPRVTFFTPMVEKFWDNDTQDWLEMWVDAAGQPAEASAPGAKKIPIGRLLVESVLAHELGHICDQIMLTDAILIHLFLETGSSLVSSNPRPEDRAQIDAAMREAEMLLGGCVLADGAARGGMGSAGAATVSVGAGAATVPVGAGAATVPARAGTWLSRLGDGARVSEDELKDVVRLLDSTMPGATRRKRKRHHSHAGDLDFGAFVRFSLALRKLGRAAEATADRYAVVEQGKPDWTALMDAVLALDSAPETSERAKCESLRRLMRMGPERYADAGLAQLAKVTDLGLLDFNAKRTHPAATSRIKQDYLFARDKKGIFGQLAKLDTRSPDERLLVLVQLHENIAREIDRKIDHLKPHESYEMQRDHVMLGKLRAELAAVEAQMEPYLAMIDRLVGPIGLLLSDNDFVERALSFVDKKGVDLADKASFKRLLDRWKARLDELLADDSLPEQQREVGEERLAKIDKLLSACDRSRAAHDSSNSDSSDSSDSDDSDGDGASDAGSGSDVGDDDGASGAGSGSDVGDGDGDDSDDESRMVA